MPHGSENPQDHFVYVWNKFLKGDKCKAKHIVIVAHSFGGVVTLHALRNVDEAVDRIKAVAFTDSVHCVSFRESSKIKKLFKNKARNWASSSAPLDTPLAYYESDCEVVSAGTIEHVWTSHCAKKSVFKYFKEKLEEEETNGKGKGHQGDENEPKTESTQSGDEKGAELGLNTETTDAIEDVEKKNVDADTPTTTENKELKNQFGEPTNFDGQEQGVGNKVVEQKIEENKDTLVPEKTKNSEKQETQKEEKVAYELKPTDEEPKQKSDKEDVLKKEKESTCGQNEVMEHTPTSEGDLKAVSGEEEQIKDEKNNKDKTISEDELSARFGNEEQKKEETGQDKKIDDDDPMTEDNLKTLDSIPSSDAVQDRDKNTTGTPEGSDVEMKDEEKKDDDVQQPMDET